VQVVEGPKGLCAVQVEYKGEAQVFPMEKVAAMMLIDQKRIAEADQGSSITDSVVTCPVYATEAERAAMLDAARIAGLNPLRVLNETTATALGYGIYKTDLPADGSVNVAIVDYGEVGIQVSIVSLAKAGLKVLSHAWDTSCGGLALDTALFEHVRAEFKSKTGLDLRENIRSTLRAYIMIEKCKKILSANPNAPLSVECVMDDRDINMLIQRDTFEELCRAPLAGAESAMRRALEQSGLSQGDIAAVECVGGSSRVPAFIGSVRAVFDKDPSRTIHTKEGVSRGAALQCAMLSPIFRVRDFSVQDALPYPVAVEYENPEPKEGQAPVTVQTLFKKGATYPTAVKLTLNRKAPFSIKLRYADDAELLPGQAREIAEYQVGPFSLPAGGDKAKLKVQIGIDIHGRAVVESCMSEEQEVVVEKVPKAKAPEEKKEADVAMEEGAEAKAEEGGEAKAEAAEPEFEEVTKTVVKRNSVPVAATASWGLSDADLTKAKEHEFDMALVDKLQEETNNAKNDLEAYILSMRSKLYDQLSGFVEEAANEAFRAELTAAEDWLYDEGEDTTKGVYAEKLSALRAKGDPIQRRHDEFQGRPAAAAALDAVCAKYAELAASTAPEYAHISEDDRAKVKGECDAASAWLNEKRGYQDAMGKHEEPILTVAEIARKAETVERVCGPIMSQPAPKVEPPKKEDEEKMEDAEEGEHPEDGEANGMETDEPAAPEAPTMETD